MTARRSAPLDGRQGKPWFQVACKLGDLQIDPALEYYRSRLKIPRSYQVVLEGERDFI